MRKLGSVESVEDFVLAIAGGADVNGTLKGIPLVDYFLRELISCPGMTPYYEIRMAKYQALVAAGADVKHLISHDPAATDNFGYLIHRLTVDMQLLSILLTSPQARELIQESPLRRSAMENVLQGVRELLPQLEELEGMDEETR